MQHVQSVHEACCGGGRCEDTERGRWANTQVMSEVQVCVRTYGNHQGSIGHELGEGIKEKLQVEGLGPRLAVVWAGGGLWAQP